MINLEDIENIYLKLKNTKGGKNADYIPELKKVNPNLYAISIFTIDGYEYDIGDYDTEFSIQSCSKVFTLALALEKYGIQILKSKIGTHKSYEKFDSINAIENDKTHTINSFDNVKFVMSLSIGPGKILFIKICLVERSNAIFLTKFVKHPFEME